MSAAVKIATPAKRRRAAAAGTDNSTLGTHDQSDAATHAAAAAPPASTTDTTGASSSPLKRGMQATVKLIGAASFLVYLLGGAGKFAFLVDTKAARPPFLLDAVTCLALLLVLAFVPHWIRTFGVLRPAAARGGRPYDVRYTRLAVAAATDADTDEGRLVARLTGCHQNGLEAFGMFGACSNVKSRSQQL
jgi:hypothetical protein